MPHRRTRERLVSHYLFMWDRFGQNNHQIVTASGSFSLSLPLSLPNASSSPMSDDCGSDICVAVKFMIVQKELTISFSDSEMQPT